LLTGFDIDVEYTLEPLSPSHSDMLLSGGTVSLVGDRGLAALVGRGSDTAGDLSHSL